MQLSKNNDSVMPPYLFSVMLHFSFLDSIFQSSWPCTNEFYILATSYFKTCIPM